MAGGTNKFSDKRFYELCTYCGEAADTRDHTPSKALLSKPFPDNLPIVPACEKCNNGFSIDEEYVSCFLDCVLTGSTSLEASLNEKTKQSFRYSTALQQLIQASRRDSESGVSWEIDEERFKRILCKLARGHAVYENTEQQFYEPAIIRFMPFNCMNETNRLAYESKWEQVVLWPEVGSRGFIKKVENKDYGWKIVQPGIYRYNVLHTADGLLVQIVLREYIGCEILWE